jgi:hypothetical protein
VCGRERKMLLQAKVWRPQHGGGGCRLFVLDAAQDNFPLFIQPRLPPGSFIKLLICGGCSHLTQINLRSPPKELRRLVFFLVTSFFHPRSGTRNNCR